MIVKPFLFQFKENKQGIFRKIPVVMGILVASPTSDCAGNRVIFRDTCFTGNIANFALTLSNSNLPGVVDEIQKEIAQNAFAGAIAIRFVKGTPPVLGSTKFDNTSVMKWMDWTARTTTLFLKVIQRLKVASFIV